MFGRASPAQTPTPSHQLRKSCIFYKLCVRRTKRGRYERGIRAPPGGSLRRHLRLLNALGALGARARQSRPCAGSPESIPQLDRPIRLKPGTGGSGSLGVAFLISAGRNQVERRGGDQPHSPGAGWRVGMGGGNLPSGAFPLDRGPSIPLGRRSPHQAFPLVRRSPRVERMTHAGQFS